MMAFDSGAIPPHAFHPPPVTRVPAFLGLNPETLALAGPGVLREIHRAPFSLAHEQEAAERGAPVDCKNVILRWNYGCMNACRMQLFVAILGRVLGATPQEVALAQYLVLFQNASHIGQFDGAKARLQLLKLGMKKEQVDQIMLQLGDASSSLGRLFDGALRLAQGQELPLIDQQLAAELKAFVEVTERPLLKIHLETQSQNFYQDLFWLAMASSHGSPRFDAIDALLNPAQDIEVPPSHRKIQWLSDVEGRPPIGQLLSIHSLIGTKKAGINPSCFVSDHMANVLFWKQGTRFSIPAEAGASAIAAIVTDNLVPVALMQSHGEPATEGVVQPYIPMKRGPFAPKNFLDNHFDPSKLTQLQKEQLFVHMIADRIISNYDTHTGQFRVDGDGNVVGFDKGQAFKYFEERGQKVMGRPEPTSFDPSYYFLPLEGPEEPTYVDFANYLQAHPEEAEEIFYSPTVQSAFERAQKLSRETIADALGPYAKVAFKGGEEPFFSKVHERCQAIKKQMKDYFQIGEGPPSKRQKRAEAGL